MKIIGLLCFTLLLLTLHALHLKVHLFTEYLYLPLLPICVSNSTVTALTLCTSQIFVTALTLCTSQIFVVAAADNDVLL